MQKLVTASLFAFLLSAGAAGQEAVEIKMDKPEVGDRARHTREEKSDTKYTITVMGNEMLKTEKKTKSLVYIEEVLAVPQGADRATKLTRTFEKARIANEGEERVDKLDIEGKTVLIEKKGDKFTFTVDGKSVEGESLRFLDGEFNKPDGQEPRDLMMPKKPVKPGDTWKIDTGPLAKGLGGKEIAVDKDKMEASGKLLKAYQKDGKQFGVLEFKVAAPITGLGENAQIKVKEGSMAVTMTGDGCIDGTSAEGKSTMQMKMKIDGKGEGFELKVDATVTEDRTTTPLPKK